MANRDVDRDNRDNGIRVYSKEEFDLLSYAERTCDVTFYYQIWPDGDVELKQLWRIDTHKFDKTPPGVPRYGCTTVGIAVIRGTNIDMAYGEEKYDMNNLAAEHVVDLITSGKI